MKRGGPIARKTPLKATTTRRTSGPARRGATVVCERPECGKSVYVPPGQVGKRRFCSRECMGFQIRAVRVCEVCEDEFHNGNPAVKTCPKRECRSEIRARSKRGARNPMSGPRTSRKREWFSSKGACCSLCSSRANLKLHHVVYEQHVRKYGGDVYEPANGFTVCMTCHNKHHHAADDRIATSQLRPENIEFAFELLGAYAADYFIRYYDDDSGGALMKRALEMQAAA